MYLLVFVTLVVALTGIYAQVLSIQTARLYSGQTTIASALSSWHTTAVAQAQSAGISPPGPAGCSLTTNAPGGIPLCTSGVNSVTVDGAATLPLCSATVTATCWTSLPPGYNKTPYTFYSIFYQPAAGQSYVLTFVSPPTISAANPPPGYIMLPTLPTATQIGATMSDLFAQIKNSSNIPAMSYGMISFVPVAGQNELVTSTLSNGVTATSFSYTLPTGGVVPLNSIALVSPM